MYYVIASGKKKSKIGKDAIENVTTKLHERGVDFKLLVSEYPRHAVELAKEASSASDCTAIIAVGGDGTFYEVLNGMDTKNVPIGLIPAGTGNDFARTLGITVDIDQCLDNIIGQEPVYVDYLLVNKKLKAFNLVGSGFDIQLLEKEVEYRKKYSDKRSYNAALMNTIFGCKFEKIKFKVDDGEEVVQDMFLAECSNGKWGGGMLPLSLESDPHDGVMEFSVIRKFNKIGLIPLLLKFQKGKIPETDYVKYYPCKKVEFDLEPRLRVQLDGEISDLFPVTVELIHNELRYFKSKIPPVDPYEILKHKKKYN